MFPVDWIDWIDCCLDGLMATECSEHAASKYSNSKMVGGVLGVSNTYRHTHTLTHRVPGMRNVTT